MCPVLHERIFSPIVVACTGLSERFEEWRQLYLWSNHEAPDLDPVRMLMAHLYCIGWKGGSLFPSFEELENPPSDGVYKTKLEEDDLYGTLNPIYRDILKRLERLGTHTGRKTAYLWAALMGQREVAAMMLAGHHKCPKVVAGYIQDALSIIHVCECFNDSKQKLGTTWHSPFSLGGENAQLATAPGAQWQKPMPEIVVGFIETVVGISPLHPQSREPQYVYDQVLQWRKPKTDPAQALKASLRVSHHICASPDICNISRCQHSANTRLTHSSSFFPCRNT